MTMKKTALLFVFTMVFSLFTGNIYSEENHSSYYGKKKVKIGVSESDAEIYVNGRLIGKGSTAVTVPKNSCFTVTKEKWLPYRNY